MSRRFREMSYFPKRDFYNYFDTGSFYLKKKTLVRKFIQLHVLYQVRKAR